MTSKQKSVRNNLSPEKKQQMKDYIEYASQIFAEKFNTDFAHMQIFGDFLREMNIPKSGFETNFAAFLAYYGWFIFASGWGGFMPKMHQERSVLVLDTWDCEKQFAKICQKTHKSYQKQKSLIKQMKTVLKGDKSYILTLNTDFDEAMKEIDAFQIKKQDCNWVEPGLIRVLVDLKNNPYDIDGIIVQAMTWELREEQTNKLVAADLGYRVGGIYASMTGYSDRQHSGLGMLQLFAQGSILKELGFSMWDFGMSMEYKIELGAQIFQRNAFLMRQKIGKTIKVQNINTFNQLEIKPTNIKDIASFQKIKQSFFNNLERPKNSYKRPQDVKDQIKNIEKKSVNDWNKDDISLWIKLRYKTLKGNKGNMQIENEEENNIENYSILLEYEELYKLVETKNKTKKIVRQAKKLQEKQQKKNKKQ